MSGAPDPVALGPGEGRVYAMGALQAVFKADGAETGDRFSVSEWRLEPRCAGPGAHSHAEADEVFLVMEGEAAILIGESWRRLPAGATAVIPRGVVHDFRNEGATPLRLFNVFVGGPFEAKMPAIVDWFRENPVRSLDATEH